MSTKATCSTSPDGLMFDSDWTGFGSRLTATTTMRAPSRVRDNNQMLAGDPVSGEIHQLPDRSERLRSDGAVLDY